MWKSEHIFLFGAVHSVPLSNYIKRNFKCLKASAAARRRLHAFLKAHTTLVRC